MTRPDIPVVPLREAARILGVSVEAAKSSLRHHGIRSGYPRAAVEWLATNRPGRGARTDLQETPMIYGTLTNHATGEAIRPATRADWIQTLYSPDGTWKNGPHGNDTRTYRVVDGPASEADDPVTGADGQPIDVGAVVRPNGSNRDWQVTRVARMPGGAGQGVIEAVNLTDGSGGQFFAEQLHIVRTAPETRVARIVNGVITVDGVESVQALVPERNPGEFGPDYDARLVDVLAGMGWRCVSTLASSGDARGLCRVQATDPN